MNNINIHNLINNLDFVFATNGEPALASDCYDSVEAFMEDVLGVNHEEWEEMFNPLMEGETYESAATKVVLPGEPLPKRVWTNGNAIIARLDEDFN